jgi:beta-glucanase (GH16 family)
LGLEWVFDTKFSYEFNGQALDTGKWWDFNPEWFGRKPAYFALENVSVKDDMLQLMTRVQKPEEVTVENKVRGYDKFTASTVKSKERIKYGYFESRCKSMKGGVFSTFWLYGPLDPPENPKKVVFQKR